MAAQEFSSPGDHMASSSSGGLSSTATIWSPGTQVGPGWSGGSSSSGSSSVNHRDPNEPYADLNYDVLNNTFFQFLEALGGYGSSAYDYSDSMHDMFSEYKEYNDELWNRAKEYDEYMSNTAIQRQVEDLKKAGLNPILAAYQGGASYKGIDVPYVSINPASALQAYTGYDSTRYASDSSRATQLDVIKLSTSSQQMIAQFNKTMDFYAQKDMQAFQNNLVLLKRDADAYLSELEYNHSYELQKFGFQNEKDLVDFKKNLNQEYEKWFDEWYYGHSKGHSYETGINVARIIQGFIPFATSFNFNNAHPVGFNAW